MAARDGDTALWLHNKLGSTDDLWSGNSICAQLSRDKLLNIHQCFYNLQPYVKVKLMLAFLHLPKRNIEEWKSELSYILQLAQADPDQWVAMVGDLLKTFPNQGCLNTDADNQHRFFHEVLNDLKKLVKKSADAGMLPLECPYLSRSAVGAVVGQQAQPAKHFALKRKPKSAALRAELLQKSVEAAHNLRKNATMHSIPVKMRSFAKKDDNKIPMRGIPSRTPTSGGFLRSNSLASRSFAGSTPLGGRTHNSQKEGGIKLLDITEQPITPKDAKRRRKLAETKAAEQKKELEAQTNQTPDYAAGLVSSNILNLSEPVAGVATSVSYAPAGVSRVMGTNNTVPAGPVSNATQQARDNLQLHLQQQLGQVATNPGLTPTPSALHTPPLPGGAQMGAAPPAQQAAPTEKREVISVPTEHYQELMSIFNDSPNLSKPEKDLILCFAGGVRKNPCPEKGDIINIRLSEQLVHMRQSDGLLQPMNEVCIMQLNYATGQWRKQKKYTVHDRAL